MKFHLPNVKRIVQTPRTIAVTALLILWAIITATNFPWHTSFTGWDNLHPEYNFWTNFTRAIFGVWQAHEGLGHTGGHGYAATIPHTMITLLESIVLPTQYIRSTFTFLMLAIGMLGCFALAERILQKKSVTLQAAGAFFAAAYYLLNFGTVQQFATQLEAFIVQYAAAPLLLLFALKLTDRWSRKDALLFLTISVISTTQGFIPPLFITYVIILTILVTTQVLVKPNRRTLTIALFILVSTLCVNAYWLLPVAHFTLTSINNFLQSYNNLLSTQSWIDANNAYGTLSNLSVLKGFPSQAVNMIERGVTVYVFDAWLQHLRNPIVVILGWSSFAIIIVGFIAILLKGANEGLLWVSIGALFFFSLLATRVPIFSRISQLIQTLPIIRQAFRAEFTKISIIVSLLYSICFGYGITTLLTHILLNLDKLTHTNTCVKRIGFALLVMIVGVGAIVFALPTFQGHFLYEREKITVPEAYTQAFKYFNSQSSVGKIMLLPQGDHWGWDYDTWGYTGSGFLWFGVPQPILERAFDVWSPYNENYYWELSYALYSENQQLLQHVFDKYNIKYVLFDDSMIPYFGSKSIYYTNKIFHILENIKGITRVKTIPMNNPQRNTLSIFTYTSAQPSTRDVQLIEHMPDIYGDFAWMQQDVAYESIGNYKTSGNSLFFPFRSLFSERQQSELSFGVKEKGSSIVLTAHVPSAFQHGTLTIPQTPDVDEATRAPIPISLSLDGTLLVDSLNKTATTAARLSHYTYGTLEATIGAKPYFDSAETKDIVPSVHRCDDNAPPGNYKISQSLASRTPTYHLVNTNSSACYDLFIPSIPHKSGYLVSISSNHTAGLPLTLQIINSTSTRVDETTFLTMSSGFTNSYLIVPPMEFDGVGYSLRISNDSKSEAPSINDIGRLIITPIPYKYLSSLKITNGDQASSAAKIVPMQGVTHPNPAFYTASIPSTKEEATNGATLVISQSFDNGWIALKPTNKFPFLVPAGKHVLVNNWENGWVLASPVVNSSPFTVHSNTTQASTMNNGLITIYIFFWPQILEWIGFLLIPVTFLWAFRIKE